MTTYTTVAALLAEPDRWCKGPFAKTASGEDAYPLSSDAHSFCLMGAMFKVYSHMGWYAALTKLQPYLPRVHTNASEFNEHPDTTHAMVLDVVRKAGI